MMVSSPGSAEADIMVKLIKILADPKQYQGAIAAFMERLTAAESAEASLKASIDTNTKLLAEATQAVEKLEAAKVEFDAYTAKVRGELDAKGRDLNARSDEMDQREAALADKVVKLKALIGG